MKPNFMGLKSSSYFDEILQVLELKFKRTKDQTRIQFKNIFLIKVYHN